MDYQDILWEQRGPIGILTFNRPEKLNAVSQRLIHESLDALEQIDKDDAFKALIITGSGRGFCSGADLTADRGRNIFAELSKRDERKFLSAPVGGFSILCSTIHRCRVPVIMAVNGITAGAGLGLCLAGDIRIASTEARFSAIFVRRGLSPDTGTTYFLPRIIGTARALEMMFTGDMVDAAEALKLGLVSRVVEPPDLMATALALAERIASGPSIAIELAKKLTYEGLRNTLDTQLGYEAWAVTLCGNSEDGQEGRRSFIEKRQPVFKGR